MVKWLVILKLVRGINNNENYSNGNNNNNTNPFCIYIVGSHSSYLIKSG